MKKKQKQSVYQFMKKSLRKEYFYLKKELLLYCPVDFGKFSADTYYAAFDKDGISIYQYDKTVENRLRLLERHPWKSWHRVKVDHFFKRSEFLFQGQPNRMFHFLQNGKEAQRIIQEHTSIEIEEAERPWWRKLPGFRSKTPLNMYVAALFYTILAAYTLKLLLPYRAEIALFSFSILSMLLGLLFLTIGLIEPSIVLPKTKEKTRQKVAYYYSYLTVCGFISIFIFW
ncbi:MAG: hypothetical protein ACE3JP_11980 [Ectobacillus sp.]